MKQKFLNLMGLVLALIVSACATTNSTGVSTSSPAGKVAPWIEASNKLAAEYSHSWAQIFPESGSGLGYREYDTKATRLDDEVEARVAAHLSLWKTKLSTILKNTEKEIQNYSSGKILSAQELAEVVVDVRVLMEDIDQSILRKKLEEKYGEIPFDQVADGVFYSLRDLINEQSPKERKLAGIERFKKYVRGFDDDGKRAQPRTEAAKNRTERRLKLFTKTNGPSRGRVFVPLRAEVENYLKNSPKVVEGVGEVLAASGSQDWKSDYEAFKVQNKTYDNWLRTTVLPLSRADHKLPKEIYAWTLRSYGHRESPDEVRKRARTEFKKSLVEYRAVAKEIAVREGLKETTPNAVLAHFKKNVETDPVKIRARYEKADADLSDDIRKRDLATLPAVPLRIRVASEAESRIQPVPHLTTPPLIGNTGERPEFVVPIGSGDKLAFDDFAFNAAAKSLTAHEGRPGHDLQFSAILDRGVSTIRANYAFNSVNVEGWALYAEWLMEPSLSLDEKMGLLMARMMRNARMFLDPEVQMGIITPKEAKRVITQDVAMSPEWADLELQRYMYKSPAQAPSYFYGYLKLRDLRENTMKRLGSGFGERCFHDAILNAGLLPLEILAEQIAKLECPKAARQ